MNILLEPQITPEMRQRYLLLELDSFRVAPQGDPIASYCLLDRLDLSEMLVMQQYLDLHSNLMPNYRQRNWNLVNQAIDDLRGRWNCQLDSFYDTMAQRVKELQNDDPPQDWDGVIDRY
jgi:hypothetical protein